MFSLLYFLSSSPLSLSLYLSLSSPLSLSLSLSYLFTIYIYISWDSIDKHSMTHCECKFLFYQTKRFPRVGYLFINSVRHAENDGLVYGQLRRRRSSLYCEVIYVAILYQLCILSIYSYYFLEFIIITLVLASFTQRF